jgi:hypothetical protein
MAKVKKPSKTRSTGRANRIKLSAAESLRRMKAFGERKEGFIAAVRKGPGRSLSA